MKVKVKFRDTEFGQFWAQRRTMFRAHDDKLYRCVWLDCEWKGIPHSFLVLDQEAEGRLSEKESDDVAFFAAEQDGVWWILEEIFGEGAEVEYEGDEEMKEDNKKTVSVDVPSGTDRVTLNLDNAGGETTLRSLLMAIEADKPVAVAVKDESKFPDTARTARTRSRTRRCATPASCSTSARSTSASRRTRSAGTRSRSR